MIRYRLLLFLSFFTGCSYYINRNESSNLVVKATIKNTNIAEIKEIREKMVYDVKNLFLSYLSYPIKNKELIDYIDLSILKEKIKDKDILYKFEINIYKVIEELKKEGVLRDNRTKVCFKVNGYDFQERLVYNKDFVIYFLSSDIFNDSLCDYVFDFNPLISTITTAAGVLYVSSFSFKLDEYLLSASGVSDISEKDSVYKIFEDIKRNIFAISINNKDEGYVVFRFYGYLEFERMNKLYKYLKDKNFYIALMNNDFMEVRIKINDIEEQVSRLINLIPELNLDLIDKEKNLVVLKFIKWDLDIL